MGNGTFDEVKCASFLTKVIEHNAAAMTVMMGALGDRLGLFKALAAEGPASSDELAERASIHERYARDWLAGMHSAGYLDYDPDTGRYSLPREHRPVLVKEGHPFFQGSFLQQITGLFPAFEPVLQAFRTGEGVEHQQYSDHFSQGLERATNVWVERFLVPHWIGGHPALSGLLESGASVAELGCGSGAAVIKLASSYPDSRFVGYDIDPRCIDRARARAAEANLADRVTFERKDVSEGLSDAFDLVLCFDVLHDLPRPLEVLRQIRGSLRSGGLCLVGEWAVEEDPEEECNPLAAMMYGFSALYCIPTTRAQGGEAHGTLGLSEETLRALSVEAGFQELERLMTGHPIMGLYKLTP